MVLSLTYLVFIPVQLVGLTWSVVIKPLSGWVKVYRYTVLCTSLWCWRWFPVALERIFSGRHMSGAKRQKKFFVVPLHFFGFTSTISCFGDRCRDGQYSLVTFLLYLFFYSQWPPCPIICKSGVTCPHALWSWSHFRGTVSRQNAW